MDGATLECEATVADGGDSYSRVHIDIGDLRGFARIALAVLSGTEYGRRYSPDLALVALCQGAANHFAVLNGAARRYFDPERAGVKDIDIWLFFARPGFHPLWRRHYDLGESKFGHNPPEVGYRGRRMDFFGRSIPALVSEAPEVAFRGWLSSGKRGSSPWCLARKAAVGLYPYSVFGKVLWVNESLT